MIGRFVAVKVINIQCQPVCIALNVFLAGSHGPAVCSECYFLEGHCGPDPAYFSLVLFQFQAILVIGPELTILAQGSDLDIRFGHFLPV